ncbi:hypothetical protein BV20DRAFT_260866 [Pilatotrama ljubarskyi]|nr:hypothetical protein BV20DRAFT_260866 [Pilatotrama ljubarskyi]
MLLRTASHGIAPAITLDFLIPRTLLCRKLSQIPSRTRQRPLSYDGGSRRGSSQASQLPTASSSTLTPGAILTQLEQDHGVFHEQALATMTHAQVEAFNTAIPELRVAFSRRDLPKVRAVWEQLKKRHLLAFFGPSQYTICSSAVVTSLQHSPRSQLSEQDLQVLRDIALVCAAGGFTGGLKALMFAAIEDRRPREALALYEQYVDHLREKDVLPSSEGEDSDEPDAEVESNGDAPPAPISLVRDEILLAAIIAHAQLGSFADALQTYLKAGTRIAPTTLERTARLLQFDPALRAKVTLYARRLDTAALLARPPTFMKHLQNLTRTSATISLERLYSNAIAGATEPEPWLAVKPSQLSGTRVVLLPDFFWTSFLTSFFACRQTDLAVRLWDDMLKLGVKPDISAWNALLDGYGNMRSLNATLKTWEVMMHAPGVKPDALSYRALISALFTAEKIDEALERFRAFEREYLKKDVPAEESSAVLAVYNTTIYHLLFVSREEDAKAIKKKMEDIGPKPDITTYNTFLRYYGRKGELKTMAQVLQELEPAGVKANIYTFSTLLSALLKARSDAGHIVISFMTKQGVVPDTTTLTAIINHQLEERTPQSFKTAMDLLSQMERGDFGKAEPNAITYTSVLTAINSGDWLEKPVVEDYNRRIWETMQRRDLQPSRVIYNVLLRASLENREPEGLENAMRYYRDMWRRRVHMTNDTWYILLKGLIGKKQWELAEEVVKDLRKVKANSIPSWLRTSDNHCVVPREYGAGEQGPGACRLVR